MISVWWLGVVCAEAAVAQAVRITPLPSAALVPGHQRRVGGGKPRTDGGSHLCHPCLDARVSDARA